MDITVILQDLDELFSQKKIKEAEIFLLEKMDEAEIQHDYAVVITLLNEMVGYYRDTSNHEKSIFYADKLLKLLEEESLTEGIAYGTSLNNVGNAYRAAGRAEEALEYYQKVFQIYEGKISPEDFRYASLNNNISLVYQELGQYEKSLEVLIRALGILEVHPTAIYEKATTYTNIANTLIKCQRFDKAVEYLQMAFQIYEKDSNKDFHYSGALCSMAEALYKKGNIMDAIRYYEKALGEIELNMGKNGTYQLIQNNLQQVKEEWLKIKPTSGLELSKKYFEEYGRPLIEGKFKQYANRIAVGLFGEGSQCFGFDDDLSMDHDFSPEFNLFLTKEDFENIGEELQCEYQNLPDIFMGIQRNNSPEALGRRGVFENEAYIQTLTGLKHPPVTEADFLSINEMSLFLLKHGVIFEDKLGKFSQLRNQYLQYYPDDFWRKKLAQAMASFSQYGQYNYSRMIERKDQVTANICLSHFMEETMNLMYLLNKEFAPYYKWKFKGLNNLNIQKEIPSLLNKISQSQEDSDTIKKYIEEIAEQIMQYLLDEYYIFEKDTYLIRHCEDILNPKIKLVNLLVQEEWETFDQVENVGGRADCQDDYPTFSIMRKSQYLSFPSEVVLCYLKDFKKAKNSHWNLITEKYARMMESTHPEEYFSLQEQLPKKTQWELETVNHIVEIQVKWMDEFSAQYPNIAANARPVHKIKDSIYTTSYETYLRGELLTYGVETLKTYGDFIEKNWEQGKNLACIIMLQTAKLYGYENLEQMDDFLNDEK